MSTQQAKLFIDGVIKFQNRMNQDDLTWCYFENFGQGQKREGVGCKVHSRGRGVIFLERGY